MAQRLRGAAVTIREHNYYLWETMEHCDVTIVGPDAVARPAHRAVIRYASSGLAHEIHEARAGVVHLAEDPAMINAILEYVYLGDYHLPTMELSPYDRSFAPFGFPINKALLFHQHLFAIAIKWNIHGLASLVRAKLLETINLDFIGE